MSKEAVTFQITDDKVAGVYKDIFEKKTRDFSQDKGFVLNAGGYAVFEK